MTEDLNVLKKEMNTFAVEQKVILRNGIAQKMCSKLRLRKTNA